MADKFIKSGLFRVVSYFLVFLLSFNAVFLGFAKEAAAEVVAGPPVVVAASLLIAAGLSFTDTDSLQSAVQTFQDTNSEGWALIEAAAGAAYAYGSVYTTDVSDTLWENVINYVDTAYNVGENPIYENTPFGNVTPDYFMPLVSGLLLSSGSAWVSVVQEGVNGDGDIWRYTDSNPDNVPWTLPFTQTIQYKTYIYAGQLYVDMTMHTANGTYAGNIRAIAQGAVAAAGISGAVAAAVGTITGDQDYLDQAERIMNQNNPNNKKVGFPWPAVGGGAAGLAAALDYLLGKHSPDVVGEAPGLGEAPYSPPYIDPANPPEDAPSTDVGWLENIWRQTVATKTVIQTLTKTVSDFINPPTAVSVNLEPLKLTGVALTNVFPFSLPWDLARSMNPFYTTSSFEPIFNLGPFDMPGVGACTWAINLSNWSAAVTLVRAMELLFFDIGLVLLTRKLMGGAV